MDLATKLMNGKYLKSAKLTDVYAKVKKLVGYGVDLPQSFQWTLLELESARLFSQKCFLNICCRCFSNTEPERVCIVSDRFPCFRPC